MICLKFLSRRDWLLRVCRTSLLKKTVGKGEIACYERFLLFHSVFYPLGELSAIFNKFEIVVCKVLSVWKSLKIVAWESVNCDHFTGNEFEDLIQRSCIASKSFFCCWLYWFKTFLHFVRVGYSKIYLYVTKNRFGWSTIKRWLFCGDELYSFYHTVPSFNDSGKQRPLKKLWKKEKMLVTSISPFPAKFSIYSKHNLCLHIFCHLQYFQFWPVFKFVVL